MDKSQKQYVEEKKPDTKDNLYDSNHLKFNLQL